MPRNPNKTPCGIPGCRAWAIRGSNPPRCSPHRHSKQQPTIPDLAETPIVGAPPGNQNRLVHGFYSTILRSEDGAGLLAFAADTTVDAEIAITRVALRRILGMLLTGTTPGPDPVPLDLQDYARFAGLAFQGANTISRLLRARKDLSSDSDPLTSALYQALEELGEELGVEL